MRFIFSFITLLVYLIMGFFQSPMVTFAMQENVVHEMKTSNKNYTSSMDCCGNEIVEQDDEDCDHECCFQSKGFVSSNISNLSSGTNKIQKYKVINLIDIYAVSINSFSNKNLVNKTSPPLYNREIKNYSFGELVKIIKSNI